MAQLTREQQVVLRSTSMLKDLMEDEFVLFLQNAKVASFTAKQQIIQEGSTDTSLYFMLSGQVRVYRKDPQGQDIELAQLSKGDFFGELSLLDNLPRSASISATQNAELLFIDRDSFFAFSKTHPAMMTKILTDISLRFRSSNEVFYKNIIQKNKELEEAYRQLKTLDEQKSKFVALTSHEIKTPLTIMVGSLQLLTDGIFGPLDPKVKNTVEKSMSGGKRLNGIINRIIDVSMNNNVDAILKKEDVNVLHLVQEIQDDLALLLKKRTLHISTHVPADLELSADMNNVKQIILNLFLNAIRFTPDGGHIEIRATAPDPAHVQISINDDGIGIAKDKQKLIFSPFYKVASEDTHTSGDVEFGSGGIGLGLTIVKSAVELHKGTVAVESELNEGSVFTVTLPVT